MSIKSCIFDMDGTLLDTIGDITNAVNETLDSFGFEKITVNECSSYIGSGTRALLNRAVGKELPESEFSVIFSEYMKNYRNNLMGETTVYDGIYPLLARLSENGILLSVCSNKPDDCVDLLVEHFFKKDNFFAAYGQRDGIPVKPNPYFAERIIEKSGISKDDTVMIGDSAQDVMTGKNAGIKTLSVLWGYQSREKISAAGGTDFFETPYELGDFILNGK